MTVTHGGNIFELARQRSCDWRDIIDFSASINPLGPAPGVRQAIIDALDRIVHYPEREPAELKKLLAVKWAVNKEQILLGNGATELIFFLARTLSGMDACLRVPVFSEFHRAFPDANFVESQHSREWPAVGIMVLTRPENPTGFLLEADSLKKWLATTEQIVILDESFVEFSSCPSFASMVEERPNLIVLRSLTKFYALPGLRIGALVASRNLIEQWQATREPWQVNVLASAAAIAALHDDDHAAKSKAFVENERAWLEDQCSNLAGASVQRSHTNFIHIRLDFPADLLKEHLLEQNILIRDCSGWPGVPDESVRIAVRTRKENTKLLDAWRKF